MTDLSHVDGYPEIPVSLLASRGVLLTGEWRNMRPVARERRAPCSDACPAAIPVPRYLHLLSQGRLPEAYEAFTLRNPFPAVTGRVCPHFCETACNREAYDGPLSIRALERYLGDAARGMALPGPEGETGRQVAVVGSGPAGLSAAYYLRRSGHRVVVYEKRERPGGLLRYGIPEYRLPEAVVDAEVARLEALGVEFRTGVSLGAAMRLGDLAARHDAVVVATGAWEGQALGLPGESLFEPGLEYLEQVARGRRALPGRRCAVVGGGNTAMDVARVLRRLGAEVTVLYRRTAAEMPAIAEEAAAAARDGVRFEFLALPAPPPRKAGRCASPWSGCAWGSRTPRAGPVPAHRGPAGPGVRCRCSGPSRAGRPDSLPRHPAGEAGRLAGRRASVRSPPTRGFAAGDLATGPGTVVAAIARGRMLAAAVYARLGAGTPGPSGPGRRAPRWWAAAR